jgi:hypothetical protein
VSVGLFSCGYTSNFNESRFRGIVGGKNQMMANTKMKIVDQIHEAHQDSSFKEFALRESSKILE